MVSLTDTVMPNHHIGSATDRGLKSVNSVKQIAKTSVTDTDIGQSANVSERA